MIRADRAFPLFVLLASAVVVGTALVSQYWGGLQPCELCLLQRWPWYVAIVVALVAGLAGSRAGLPWVALLLAVVFVVSCGFAFYHVGVEQHWFAGPTACTANPGAADSLEALKAQILAQQPVRCDEVAWSLWGVSMAGWNLLASLVMAACCVAAWLRWRTPAAAPAGRRGLA